MQKTLLASILAFTSISANADYQFEANFGYTQGDIEEIDLSGYVLAASIYFESVDDSKGPLAEAAFLDKASNVSIAFGTEKFDDFDFSEDNFIIAGRYVTQNNWIFEGSLIDIEVDAFGDDFSDKTLSIAAGKYLTDTSELIFTYSTADESDVDTLEVDYHSLINLNGSAYFSYDFGVDVLDIPSDTGFGFSAGVTYHPILQTSIGIDYNYISVADFDTRSLSIFAEYFFTHNISGSIVYTKIDEDDSEFSVTTDTIALGVTGRF